VKNTDKIIPDFVKSPKFQSPSESSGIVKWQSQKSGNKTASINEKNIQFIRSQRSQKTQKSQKGDTTQHIVIQGGLYHLCDSCGFWSVAVNTMYKVQFLALILM